MTLVLAGAVASWLRMRRYEIGPCSSRRASYPGFCDKKQLGLFLLLLGWDAGPLQGYHQHNSPGTNLFTSGIASSVR